jgi:hypothetical protein
MPLEPADEFGLLRDARCDTLDAYQQQLLAARCGAGASAEEIAHAWPSSKAAINREFQRIGDIVLGRTGLEANVTLMTLWFHMHLDELPMAAEVMARRAVFSHPPPPRHRRHTA